MRETAAQALGAAARARPDSVLPVLARHLCALAGRTEWEARLGGLLGLKYLLAARTEAAAALLPHVLPAARLGLQVWPSQSLLRSLQTCTIVCFPLLQSHFLATPGCTSASDWLHACLQDGQEDVRAVSAEALLPVAGALSTQGRHAGDVSGVLWDVLLKVDDLSPSTGNH